MLLEILQYFLFLHGMSQSRTTVWGTPIQNRDYSCLGSDRVMTINYRKCMYSFTIWLFQIISIPSKVFLFSSVRPRDFDGMLGTGLPMSMYTTKTTIDMWRFNIPQLKEFLTFSVNDRYQLNYFICIKDFNCIDNYFFKIKIVFFLYLWLSASSKENDLPLCMRVGQGNRNYSAILATLLITSYALGV